MVKELSRSGLINDDCITATGKTVGENIKDVRILDGDVIRSLENPYHEEGGLAVLFGNLAPEGCVVKQSAVLDEMLRHEGPARIFNSEEDASQAIMGGKIKKEMCLLSAMKAPWAAPECGKC